MERILLCVLILCNGFIYSHQQCTDGDLFGVDPATNNNENPSTPSQTGYFTDYTINCCGVLKSYEVITTSNGDLTFQLWRASGSDYELIYQQTNTISSSPAVVLLNGIGVVSGDRWGWWTNGPPLVKLKTGAGCGGCVLVYRTLPSLSIGAVETWTTTPITTHHAIQLTVGSNTPPSFTNLDGVASISDSASIGFSVFTVFYTDPDTSDTVTVAMTADPLFSFNAASGEVSVASSLLSATTPVTLSFTVSDQCNIAVVTNTLTVTLTNLPPVINNLNSFTELFEDSTGEVLLYTLNVTDPDGSPFTCSLVTASSTASSITFINVRLKTASSDWAIYTQPAAIFNYRTINVFNLRIKCEDHRDAVTGTFNVYILANEKPYFTNLPNSTTLSTNAAIGTTIFTVLATDTNVLDTLTFAIQCDPVGCPITLLQSGAMLLSSSISTTTTVGYDVSVTVSDLRSTSSVKVLTVLITDINGPPKITNLDTSFSVGENSALGVSIVTTRCQDVNAADTLTYTMACSPSSSLTYFDISSSDGKITTSPSTSINYETIAVAGSTTFVCSVTCSDGKASSSKSVNLTVINVNEAPVFGQSQYTISANEGTANTVLSSSGFTVTDQDIGDTSSFSLDCGSSSQFFTINSTTGVISFASDYDLDDGIRTTLANCILTATDSNGLTAVATLDITINDVNDNSPVFTQSSFVFTATSTAVNTVIGSVNATDADTSNFGVFVYSLDQSSLGDQYFEISSTGELSVILDLAGLGSATVNPFKVLATDTGGNQVEATVTILIPAVTTTTESINSDRYLTFFEEPKNIPWFMACCIVALIIPVLIIWLVYTSDPSHSLYKLKCCKLRREYRMQGRHGRHRE